MKIDIINLSDLPAKISKQEQSSGISTIKNLGFIPNLFSETFGANGVDIFNKIMISTDESGVLFSSGGTNAVNNILGLCDVNKVISRKVLIGYSDTLHIQSKYTDSPMVDNIYGLTLRNISDLKQKEKEQLSNFISTGELSIPIKNISGSFDISGKVFGGHLMIFSYIYDYFRLDLNNSLLYLEFHGLEDYMINYIFNIMKLKGIFNKIKGVILDDGCPSKIINDLILIGINNIYMLDRFSYIPLFKNVCIRGENLILEK